MIRKLFIPVILVAVSINSAAQSTAYASTTVEIVTPISISKSTDMHFGTIASSETAGTVILDYADGRTTTGGATIPSGGILSKTAVFTILGENTAGFSISIPAGAITLFGGPSGSLTVDNFVCDAGDGSFLVGGGKTLKVKATLEVPANTPPGTYTNVSHNSTGCFMTVNYN
jgi:hypothetical protein